ncbi:hypothetical protein BLNAU_17508 [Blattamonas nauphoetae]|uniref:Uncharacterized protein n=1 Tax=Blattamonas nauphoetae TaxID=2049346 RepID=A0ABQ9X758_9EUKA|nr:hypothetical protein BLNAU_17508 [Blattamonas nauphoetae]
MGQINSINNLNMLAFLLTSVLSAFRFGNYEFKVEHLTLKNGTAYSLRVSSEETLYFNYMGEVRLPSECEPLPSRTIAYSIVSSKGKAVCENVGTMASSTFTLIQPGGVFTPPIGLRSEYQSASGNIFQIDLVCNRVESMRVSRSTSGSYLVTWNNPAGCARVVG